jgi:G3E family GTPase
MTGTTDVYLITGFLGSGKTTFLNRIIRAFPEDRQLMILMNEFGDLGVDGALVEGEDLDMLEISRGSIFCVCVKTDFIKGLMDIARNKQPDVLLIEATGVANPTDLKKDLRLSIFHGQFQLREQFCLIDAANFEDTYDTFTSVEKQIENATLFILNKVDTAGEDTISRVRQIIGRHHPDPEFIETQYADISLEKYLPTGKQIQGRQPPGISTEELERFIDGLMAAPGISMTPPDQLLARTLVWSARDIDGLKEMVAQIPAGIARAKGIVQTGGDIYLLNCVMGKSVLTKIDHKEGMDALLNKVVFIGPPEAIQQLDRVDFSSNS